MNRVLNILELIPRKGTVRLGGKFCVVAMRKTIMARRALVDRPILSPQSTGRRKAETATGKNRTIHFIYY